MSHETIEHEEEAREREFTGEDPDIAPEDLGSVTPEQLQQHIFNELNGIADEVETREEAQFVREAVRDEEGSGRRITTTRTPRWSRRRQQPRKKCHDQSLTPTAAAVVDDAAPPATLSTTVRPKRPRRLRNGRAASGPRLRGSRRPRSRQGRAGAGGGGGGRPILRGRKTRRTACGATSRTSTRCAPPLRLGPRLSLTDWACNNRSARAGSAREGRFPRTRIDSCFLSLSLSLGSPPLYLVLSCNPLAVVNPSSSSENGGKGCVSKVSTENDHRHTNMFTAAEAQA